MLSITPGDLYAGLLAAAFIGFVAGLFASVWYINRLRRAAGLHTI